MMPPGETGGIIQSKRQVIFMSEKKLMSKKKFSERFGHLGFLGPGMIFLFLVLIYPLAYSLRLSLYRFSLTDATQRWFMGLEQYIGLLTDAPFLQSLYLHLAFIVICVFFQLVIGLLVALFLNRDFYGDRVVRSLLLIPVFILPVVSGLTFRFMYNPQYGAINWLLGLVGFGPIEFLSRGDTAFISIIIQDIWRMWPFMFMIIYSGLQALPREPFEAVKIDGASKFQELFYLTIPMLKPTIVVAIILRTIDVLKVFTEVFVMTGGGPGRATTLLSIHIYRNAFSFFNMGYAAASSYVMVLLAMAISVILIKKVYA